MALETLLDQVRIPTHEPYFHPTSLGPECSTFGRTAHLRERRAAMAHEKRSEPADYTRLAEESRQIYLQYEAIDPALARAQALYYVVEHCEIVLEEDTLLLGGEIPFFFNLMLPALNADRYAQIANQAVGEDARRLRDAGTLQRALFRRAHLPRHAPARGGMEYILPPRAGA